MSVGFGIPQLTSGDSIVGTTAQDMRHILGALYPSTGVIDGLEVTGDTTLSYTVAPGVAVCSRGASDGAVLARYEGGTTDPVEANASSSPRLDIIWLAAHDAAQGDADNLVVVGVTQGTAAAVPVAPDIPTYATELARMLVPGGATTTANATMASTVGYAVPYGASLGTLYHRVSTFDNQLSEDTSRWWREFEPAVTLMQDRRIELMWSCCMSAVTASNPGSLLLEFKLDGVGIWMTEVGTTKYWETYYISHEMDVPKGTHTFGCYIKKHSGGKIARHYSPDSGSSSARNGETFDVIDRGLVR